LTNNQVKALATDGSRLFAGTAGGGVFVSTNSGSEWTPVNNGLPDTVVNALLLDGPTLFAGTGTHGVFLSTDNGAHWTTASNGLTNASVYALAQSGGTLLVGNSAGIFLTTNGGTNWTPSDMPALAIHALAANSTKVFASDAGGGVFVSTDGGAHWGGLARLAQVSVSSILATDAYVFMAAMLEGIGYGFYSSTDNGTNWYQPNDGLSTLNLASIAVRGTNVFLGTLGSGVWRRPLLDLGIIASVDHSSQDIPVRFVVEQNYPNPFNPSTTIRYGLPRRAQVSLSVFNTLGQRVVQLVNGDIDAGYHEIRFDGNNLASGVYFYRMTAGSYAETRKLLLLK
jgi:photosystem II stability/assembly factor-like uncharacterized protein